MAIRIGTTHCPHPVSGRTTGSRSRARLHSVEYIDSGILLRGLGTAPERRATDLPQGHQPSPQALASLSSSFQYPMCRDHMRFAASTNYGDPGTAGASCTRARRWASVRRQASASRGACAPSEWTAPGTPLRSSAGAKARRPSPQQGRDRISLGRRRAHLATCSHTPGGAEPLCVS